jgi:hypothetical protein
MVNLIISCPCKHNARQKTCQLKHQLACCCPQSCQQFSHWPMDILALPVLIETTVAYPQTTACLPTYITWPHTQIRARCSLWERWSERHLCALLQACSHATPLARDKSMRSDLLTACSRACKHRSSITRRAGTDACTSNRISRP